MEMSNGVAVGRWVYIYLAVFYMQFVAVADFLYTTNNGSITITGYDGSGGPVAIPGVIDGFPVRQIAANAFAGSGTITTIQIPPSVAAIGDGAFASCPTLTSITVDAGNPNYATLDSVLYNKAQTALIQFPGGRGPAFTVPSSVSTIAERAFKGAEKLLRLTIPSDVTSIGQEALANCTSLTNVALGNGVTSIQFATFSNCTSLKTIALPGSITNVGNYAFTFCGLINVEIPRGVISIGNVAFANCADLARVTISDTVSNIGVYAFSSCTALRGAYFEGNRPQIGTDAFINADQVTLYYPVNAAGWTSTVAGKPAMIWNPSIITNDVNFGVQNGQFSFTITGTAGVTVVVEKSYDLNSSIWMPMETNVLNGAAITFRSAFSAITNEFYRVQAP
jgi:hypothetical protein